MKLLSKAALAACIAISPVAASAAIFAVDFTGTITRTSGLDVSGGGLMVGDGFSARVVFDDQTPVTSTNLSRQITYDFLSASITFEDFDPVVQILADPGQTRSQMTLQYGTNSNVESFSVEANTGLSDGLTTFFANISVLNTNVLPAEQLSLFTALPGNLLATFTSTPLVSFSIAGNSVLGQCTASDSCFANGSLETAALSAVAPVPLPASGLLLGFGALALGVIRRFLQA